MLRDLWDRSVGSWAHEMRWRDNQRRWNNYCSHNQSLTLLPQPRPRRLTTSDSQRPQFPELSTSLGSRLLGLPAEIRFLIWEYAVGGNHVALYRENSHRLVHILLDESNTQIVERDTPIQTESIEDALLQMHKTLRKHRKRLPRAHKLSALALLQSCRLIYSEGVDLLYSHNMFVFLQNTTVVDFYHSILPERYASVRSVHFHWHFREFSSNMSRYPWNEVALNTAVGLLTPEYMPQLGRLSVFIQGPLTLTSTCKDVLSHLRRLHMKHTAPQLKFLVVRFPYPWLLNNMIDFHSAGIEEALADPSLPFKIVRPSQPSQGTLADLDVGVDVGWRYGVLFFPSDVADDGPSGIVMKSYLVWTPLPKNGKWPYWVPM